MKKEIEKSIKAGKNLAEYYKLDDLFEICEHKHMVWVCWAHWALTNPKYGVINLCNLKKEIKIIADSIIQFDFENKKAAQAAWDAWDARASEDASAEWAAWTAEAAWDAKAAWAARHAKAAWAAEAAWAAWAAWAACGLKFETRSKRILALIMTRNDCLVARDHYLATGERHKDFLIY